MGKGERGVGVEASFLALQQSHKFLWTTFFSLTKLWTKDEINKTYTFWSHLMLSRCQKPDYLTGEKLTKCQVPKDKNKTEKGCLCTNTVVLFIKQCCCYISWNNIVCKLGLQNNKSLLKRSTTTPPPTKMVKYVRQG